MNVFELFATIRLDDSAYNRNLTNAEQRLKGFGRQAQQVGTQISTRISAPIAAIGGGIIATATQFQASMNRVQGITQATGDEFDALNELAKDLGESTQFSASQAADGMGFLAQAGFEVTEIMEALPGVLELAAAGQLSLAEAADLASNVLTGFGLQAEDVGRVNDVLAKTATSTNTNVRQLGEAFSFVAPVAAGLGVSVEEAGAAIGVLSNAGIQGSRAGTGLRRVLTTLVNESDKLGISVTEADGTLRPFADIMEDLEATGLDTSEMLEIFGDRGGPAIATLLGEGSDAIRALEGDLENAGGTAADLAETQMQGLPGAFRELRSAVEGAALALADAGLADFVENVADRITNLTRSFSDLDEGMQRIVLLVGGGAVAAGPLLVGFGLLTQAAGAAITAFRKLRTVALLLSGPKGVLIGLAVLLGGRLLTAVANNVLGFNDLETAQEKAARKAREAEEALGQVTNTIGTNADKDALRGRIDELAQFIGDENRNGWKAYAESAIAAADDVAEAERELTRSILEERLARAEQPFLQNLTDAQQTLSQAGPEAVRLAREYQAAEERLISLSEQYGPLLDAEDISIENQQRISEVLQDARNEYELLGIQVEAAAEGLTLQEVVEAIEVFDENKEALSSLREQYAGLFDDADDAATATNNVADATGNNTDAASDQADAVEAQAGSLAALRDRLSELNEQLEQATTTEARINIQLDILDVERQIEEIEEQLAEVGVNLRTPFRTGGVTVTRPGPGERPGEGDAADLFATEAATKSLQARRELELEANGIADSAARREAVLTQQYEDNYAARARAAEAAEQRVRDAMLASLNAAASFGTSFNAQITSATQLFQQAITSIFESMIQAGESLKDAIGSNMESIALAVSAAVSAFFAGIGEMIAGVQAGEQGVGAGFARMVLSIVNAVSQMLIAVNIVAVAMTGQLWNPFLAAAGAAGVVAAAYGLRRLRQLGAEQQADTGAPGSIDAMESRLRDLQERRDATQDAEERERLNAEIEDLRGEIAAARGQDEGLPTQMDEGGSEPTATDSDMGASFGGTSQGVQLAVAVPLMDAATIMRSAAQSIQAAFRTDGGMSFGSATMAFDDSVGRFGGYVDRLVEEGIAVNVTGRGSRTAAFRG